jgi:hypothetical protein
MLSVSNKKRWIAVDIYIYDYDYDSAAALGSFHLRLHHLINEIDGGEASDMHDPASKCACSAF